jgi:type II secretory pathway pseudopilin PulG
MSTTQQSALQSLLAAADAAQQAYLAAQSANSGADLSKLYEAELNAQNIYLTALNKTFTSNAAAAAAQQGLDSLTNTIKAELSTITNVSTWVTIVGNLLQLAATVASSFT